MPLSRPATRKGDFTIPGSARYMFHLKERRRGLQLTAIIDRVMRRG